MLLTLINRKIKFLNLVTFSNATHDIATCLPLTVAFNQLFGMEG